MYVKWNKIAINTYRKEFNLQKVFKALMLMYF